MDRQFLLKTLEVQKIDNLSQKLTTFVRHFRKPQSNLRRYTIQRRLKWKQARFSDILRHQKPLRNGIRKIPKYKITQNSQTSKKRLLCKLSQGASGVE